MKLKKLKNYIALALVLVLCVSLCPLQAFALGGPTVQAPTYLLMDIESRQILVQKNMHQKNYPASITKIITALLALENASLDDMVVMSEGAVFSVPRSTSHIALDKDEEISVENLLYALMLPSANDAANGLGEHVAGSIESFAAQMTARAKELGALNTNFTNANGLPEDNHYTTAYDMAQITLEAIKNPDFTRIWSTDQYDVPPTNNQPKERHLWNQLGLLVNNGYYYDNCTGGKVGWTEEAKHTLVATAEKNGRQLLVVLMYGNRMNDNFTDAATLFDYGFDNFAPVQIGADTIEAPPKVPVYKDGQQVGSLGFTPTAATVLLENGMNLQQITASYDLPQRIEYGQFFEGYVTYTLPESASGQQYSQLATVKMETADWVGAAGLLAPGGTTGQPDKSLPAALGVALLVGKIILIAIGVMATLVVLFVCFVLIRKKIVLTQRKKRREKMIAMRKHFERLQRQQYEKLLEEGQPPPRRYGAHRGLDNTPPPPAPRPAGAQRGIPPRSDIRSSLNAKRHETMQRSNLPPRTQLYPHGLGSLHGKAVGAEDDGIIE